MKYRQPTVKDELTHFANHVFRDLEFPIHSDNYYEISEYLELNGDYLQSMIVFDKAWELYIETEKNQKNK